MKKECLKNNFLKLTIEDRAIAQTARKMKPVFQSGVRSDNQCALLDQLQQVDKLLSDAQAITFTLPIPDDPLDNSTLLFFQSHSEQKKLLEQAKNCLTIAQNLAFEYEKSRIEIVAITTQALQKHQQFRQRTGNMSDKSSEI